MVMTLIFLLILGIAFFIGWASWPWSIAGKKLTSEIVGVEPKEMADPEEHPAVLKILTWNLGFLYGRGSEGPGYEAREKAWYDERFRQLVSQVREWGPDVICLQEIDFHSGRSHQFNQARELAREAGYPYVAEAVSWEANHIPFPYWPFSRHFGAMRSGGAILSRWPITSHEVQLLQKPVAHAWWYNLFYLHRYFQKVEIEVGEKKYSLINLHLEAFDKKDREGQIQLLLERIKGEKIDFVAGDFNMVPTSATKKSKFKDSQDDYENDPSFEVMGRSEMLEVVPEEIYGKDESRYFTFPAWAPDRRLDYIFYRKDLKMIRAEVLHSSLSDHLPLRASFQIGTPKVPYYQQ